jgi:two-component system, chemotaxis family, chemotaxis protein CheY
MAADETQPRGILVADHTPHMASLVGQMLRAMGRKGIREVHDAAGAFGELNRRLFDILVIDADLEGMDGVSFTARLRANATCQNRLVPVIMMSSAPDRQRIAAARDAGVTEFLRKPFAASHLESRILSIEANPRPFVEANAYKGPDRRRRTAGFVGKDRRA